jgi:hypothetical protein
MVLAFKSKLEGKKSRNQQKTHDPEAESALKVDSSTRSNRSSKSSYNPSLPQVQCSRCGDWYVQRNAVPSFDIFRGHLAGAAECPMKNDNPHDWAREQQEDPVTFMKQSIYEHKQKLILRHASIPAELRNHELLADQLVLSDDEEIGKNSSLLSSSRLVSSSDLALNLQKMKIWNPNFCPP